ncbi:MAG: hypothetical protein IPM27_01200 [Nitrosomonadales bacterium]|nr:hypothetical protein [Nitrosomonadales bacterium]
MRLYITAPSVFVLIVIYLPVVLWLLLRIYRSPRWRGAGQAGLMMFTLLLAYAIPLGDVTFNSIAMAKVCPSAGLHIYRTVEVEGFIGTTSLRDTQYQFNEEPVLRTNGTYYFLRAEKNSDGSISTQKLEQPTAEYEVFAGGGGYSELRGLKPDGHYDQETHTKKSRWLIRNRITGEVMAEWLFFSAMAGWLDRVLVYRWFGTGGGALSCTRNSDFSGWPEEILLPKHSTN